MNKISSQKEHGKNVANTIVLVDRDMIRKLTIPRPKTSDKAVLLSPVAYNKIKDNSQEISLTPCQTKTEDLEIALQKEILKETCLKKEIENLKSDRISHEIYEEEQQEKERILLRAEELKREQEDIVKKCNSLISSIECKAIQDAQIAEKELIKEELKQHENSMDDMMETERRRALHDMQKQRDRDWARKKKYAEHILEQIGENEKQRVKAMEMLQREFKLLKLRAEEQEREKLEKQQHENIRHIKLKKQNEIINERIKREKEMEREREELENIKAQQLVKCKLENEKESEKRNKIEKQRRERELARLWKIQNRSRSLLRLKDDLIADRIQEQVQRKWRERELEMVRKKKRETEELESVRAQQIRQKKDSQVTTIFEKEREAEKNALESEQLRNELLESQHKKKQRTDRYKTALQQQITEKELKLRRQREAAFKERNDLFEKFQQHDQAIQEIIKKKIDQTRSCNVPDIYVKHLEKHLKTN